MNRLLLLASLGLVAFAAQAQSLSYHVSSATLSEDKPTYSETKLVATQPMKAALTKALTHLTIQHPVLNGLTIQSLKVRAEVGYAAYFHELRYTPALTVANSEINGDTLSLELSFLRFGSNPLLKPCQAYQKFPVREELTISLNAASPHEKWVEIVVPVVCD
jgi:hypothetical protein